MSRQSSSSTSIPMVERLKQFFVELPASLQFENVNKVKSNVFLALYYAMTANGRFIDQVFHDVSPETLQILNDFQWNPMTETKSFYNKLIPGVYSHLKNLICGRKVEGFELVYRCYECGYDESCILCSKCFNKNDHVGHSVTVFGAGGGMCDCGDPSAFTPLNCNCQGDRLLEPLDTEFSNALRDTLMVVLDYILDVTNLSVLTLPGIHDLIQLNKSLSYRDISNHTTFLSDKYDADDWNTLENWHLIVWNLGGVHFSGFASKIQANTSITPDDLSKVVSNVMGKGYDILLRDSTFERLVQVHDKLRKDGVFCTIRSARDSMRELIITQMLLWIQEVLKWNGNSLVSNEMHSHLATLLLEPNFEFCQHFPVESYIQDQEKARKLCFQNGMLFEKQLVDLSITKARLNLLPEDLTHSIHDIQSQHEPLQLANSRIQFFLAFDVRFPSNIRKIIANTLVLLVFGTSEFKAEFCKQYLDVYPIFLSALAHADREPDVAISHNIADQLFTCPDTNDWIVKSSKVSKLLGPIAQMIEENCSQVNESGYFNFTDDVEDLSSGFEETSMQRAILQSVESFRRVVSKTNNKDILNNFLESNNLIFMVLFLKCFQGIAALKRKYGDHVEQESYSEFYWFLQRSIPALNIVKFASKVESIDLSKAIPAVSFLAQFLCCRPLKKTPQGVIDFVVSKEPVSLVNPINTFLSYIIRHCGVNQIIELAPSFSPFFKISDFSLRSIVLASQVKVGFWVRNGVITARHAGAYNGNVLAEYTYHPDVYLNQVAAILDDPESTLLNFLERWELASWFHGDVSHTNTVYEEKFGFICEQFLLFIYNLVVDRAALADYKPETDAYNIAKLLISYRLAQEPRTFSALRKEVQDYVPDIETVELLVSLLADFQSPQGLSDTGMYRLKSSVYETLDPLSLYLDSGSSQSIFSILVSNVAKENNLERRDVVLLPLLSHSSDPQINEKVGAFTRTTLFAKLLFKLLNVAVETEDEGFLPHLLHLIHTLLMDQEYLFGDGYIDNAYIAVPIFNHLFIIADSSMSDFVVKKAEFLLKKFVSHDQSVMESLTASFGEQRAERFKSTNKKNNKSGSPVPKKKSKKSPEERKQKILMKLAKQREAFLKENQVSDIEMIDDSEEASKIVRTCVACGEPENADDPFGIPFSTNRCSSSWKIPKENSPLVDLAFSEFSQEIPRDDDDVDFKLLGYPKDLKKTVDIGFSCNHGIHLRCRPRDDDFSLFHACPLCHNYHMYILQTFRYEENCFIGSELLSGEPVLRDFKALLSSVDFGRNERLLKSTILPEYFDPSGQLQPKWRKNDSLSPPFFRGRKDAKSIGSNMTEFTTIICTSVKANEIASRIYYEGMFNFVEQIPSLFKATIRSLIQAQVAVFNADKDKALSGELEHWFQDFWAQHQFEGGFHELVFLFFQSGESFHTLLRVCLSWLIAETAITLRSNYSNYLQVADIQLDCPLDEKILANQMEFQVKFFARFQIADNAKTKVYYRNFHFALQKCLSTFLRQAVVFLDILTCEKIGENEFRSLQKFSVLQDEVEETSVIDYNKILCGILGLRPFEEMILDLDSDDFSFEFSIIQNRIESRLASNGPLWEIEYASTIKLVSLPPEYSSTMINLDLVINHGCICLHCGGNAESSLRISHMRQCGTMGIFYSPIQNLYVSLVEMGSRMYMVNIPGPYMTKHGEVKVDRSSKATLNKERYATLNRLWLTQGLFSLSSRLLFGLPVAEIAGDGDDDDDDEYEELEFLMDEDLDF